MGDEHGVVVTLKDVYDLVLELKQSLSGAPQQLADHETRIRALELAHAAHACPDPSQQQPASRSGWQVAGIVIAAIVGGATILGVVITLVEALITPPM